MPTTNELVDGLPAGDAIDLLVDRVRVVEPTFQLTPELGASAARVCQPLDGLPLAIELAAARAKTMTLGEIEHRLDDPFSLLTLGPRSAPARQQTLRARGLPAPGRGGGAAQNEPWSGTTSLRAGSTRGLPPDRAATAGQRIYAAIWSAGPTLPLEATLEEARELVRAFQSDRARERSVVRSGAAALSARERELVVLVTRGFRNREIAEELVVTGKTAEAHINHILNKLGFTNRVQIATWGMRHELVSSGVGALSLTDERSG